jgi:hypothetical protein
VSQGRYRVVSYAQVKKIIWQQPGVGGENSLSATW